jgi:hypothetical protein
MIFGVQGEDADDLAHELASIEFDPYRIKEENFVRRQRLVGHEVRLLRSWSESEGQARQWGNTYGEGWTTNRGTSYGLVRDTRSDGSGTSAQRGGSDGGSTNHGRSEGSAEHLVPVHEDYEELANRVFSSFDEQKHVWAGKVRRLKTGSCVLRLVDDANLHEVNVDRSTPGHLEWDARTLRREYPQALESVERLKEENFRAEWFVSPSEIDRETEDRIGTLIRRRIGNGGGSSRQELDRFG